MTKEVERLERAVTAGRRKLLRTGVMKRQELRCALNKRADLAEVVAEVLVKAGFAKKEPAMHGSWRLVLTGTAQKPVEKVGPVANPVAGICHGYGDTVGVLYRLTDELLHVRSGDDAVDFDRAFTHTRAALARLTELQQRDRDAVATATLQRLQKARGATA